MTYEGLLNKKPPCYQCICVPICKHKRWEVVVECKLLDNYFGHETDPVVMQDRRFHIVKALKHPVVFHDLDELGEERKQQWLKNFNYEGDDIMLKDEIVKWLNDYCGDANKAGFVVGVSGGIDSAVTSTLCAKTGLKTIVVHMPIGDETSNAIEHMDWLMNKFSDNISHDGCSLDTVYDSFVNIFPRASGMTMANLKSRLRMVTLYAIASENDLLVCGTGNKVEDFGVGFYTKYGDGGVDISPLGDLMKSEVYDIGRELGIIPEILSATPTDGLWDDDRTDEDQLGATYDELEWAMNFKHDRDITTKEGDILDIYEYFHNRGRHKMEPIPVFKREE